MNAFKEQCIALRNKDHTLDEIAKLTGRPRTSVHFHIRSIPLSLGKRNAIKLDNAKRTANMAHERVIKHLRIFSNLVSLDKNNLLISSRTTYRYSNWCDTYRILQRGARPVFEEQIFRTDFWYTSDG